MPCHISHATSCANCSFTPRQLSKRIPSSGGRLRLDGKRESRSVGLMGLWRAVFLKPGSPLARTAKPRHSGICHRPGILSMASQCGQQGEGLGGVFDKPWMDRSDG